MATDGRASGLHEAEPIVAPVWKNLIFLKDGRTLFGHYTFRSAEEAAAAHPVAEAFFAECLALSRDHRIVERGTGRHLYYVREYSHAIPVPVRQPCSAS